MTTAVRKMSHGDSSDGEAFAERLAAELPRLVHLAARLVRDPDQAQDRAQETMVGAWQRRDQLRDQAALSAWLRRSLVNRIIDRSRRHRDELDIDEVETDWRDDRYTVAPDQVLERAELRDELEDALARLPVAIDLRSSFMTCSAGRDRRSLRRRPRACRRRNSVCDAAG